MIRKRAFFYEATTTDKKTVSFLGQTATYEHYPSMAKKFVGAISSVLNELGIEVLYDEESAWGEIDGVPVMIVYKPSAVYFWCEGMGSSSPGITLAHTGYTDSADQALGVTVKGTAKSFAVYLGSGTGIGAEKFAFGMMTMKRLSDENEVKGIMSSAATPLLYTFKGSAYSETSEVVKPAVQHSASLFGYDGLALVPAVTTSLAYLIEDCFLTSPALLADGSYYTIGGENVVVVNGNFLLKC